MIHDLINYVKSDIRQILSCHLVLIGTLILAVKYMQNDVFKLQAYRAFDLSDKSLSYNHKESLISGNLNIIISTIAMIILSVIGNGCKILNERFIQSQSLRQEFASVKVMLLPNSNLVYGNGSISSQLRVRLYSVYWGLIYGIMSIIFANLFTNFTKTALGVLKPHFLEECSPHKELVANLNGSLWVNETLTFQICSNPDTDYRRSFPSGHVSQATVSVAYGFLEVNGTPDPMLTIILQLITVGYTIYICCLRIVNNHHHWYDVLGGIVLGVSIATHMYLLKERQVIRQYTVVQVIKSTSPPPKRAVTATTPLYPPPDGLLKLPTEKESNI